MWFKKPQVLSVLYVEKPLLAVNDGSLRSTEAPRRSATRI
jgi:hypothetical protein